MQVPAELKAILDQAAGKDHSATGTVMATLAQILQRHEQIVREQLLGENDRLKTDRDIARNEAGRLTAELVRAEKRIAELEAERNRVNARWHEERRLAASAEERCARLQAEADRRLKDWQAAWAERNEARDELAKLRATMGA